MIQLTRSLKQRFCNLLLIKRMLNLNPPPPPPKKKKKKEKEKSDLYDFDAF